MLVGDGLKRSTDEEGSSLRVGMPGLFTLLERSRSVSYALGVPLF
jgi:hypothetical protein